MILNLTMPRVGDVAQRGTVHRLLARPGDVIKPGTPLLEVRVDLMPSRVQDCPPIVYFRIVATERAVLRALAVDAGAALVPGASLGTASTQADEDAGGPPARNLRTTVVAIQVDPLAR